MTWPAVLAAFDLLEKLRLDEKRGSVWKVSDGVLLKGEGMSGLVVVVFKLY